MYKYRLFCTTENDYKYVWSETAPTVCPGGGAHVFDTTSIVIVDKVVEESLEINNLPITAFDELRVAEKTTVFELKSIYGKSDLRDIYTTTGAATITNNLGDSEYALVTTTNGTDSALLQSSDRGRYCAGKQGEAGIGVRIPTTMTGNQVVKIGMFDASNGVYFKYTSAGVFACILRDGIEVASIPRTAWNVDTFDGTGPSKYLLDPTDGIIYNLRFSWYGYGNIEFRLNTTNSENKQSSFVGHIYNPVSQTSIKTPNLPISVSIANGGTAASRSVFVAGRQYSILGRYAPVIRTVSAYRLAYNINNINAFVPIISIRRKAGYLGNAVGIVAFDIIPQANLIVQVRVNVTLTGAVFGVPNDTIAAETACESDTSATALTGGIPIWTGLVTGEAKGTISNSVDINYDINETQILTVCAKSVVGGANSVNALLRWKEEW